MAVLIFDDSKNHVSVLVEKGDVIKTKDGNVTAVEAASHFTSGHMFANGELSVTIIRGERF